MRFFEDAHTPPMPIERFLSDPAWVAMPWLRGEERRLRLRQEGEVEYVGPDERLWDIPDGLRPMAQLMAASFKQPTTFQVIDIDGKQVVADLDLLHGKRCSRLPIRIRLRMLRATLAALGALCRVDVIESACSGQAKRAMHARWLDGNCGRNVEGLAFHPTRPAAHMPHGRNAHAVPGRPVARYKLWRTMFVRVDRPFATTPPSVGIEVLGIESGRWQSAGSILLPVAVTLRSCEIIEIACSGSASCITDARFVRRAPEVPFSRCVFDT